MKLYLDEDIKPVVADMLRNRGLGCLSTREAGNLGRSDSEQLAFAVHQNRAILTFNIVEFLRLAMTWAAEGRSHCGIIVSDQIPVSELLRRLIRLSVHHQHDDLSNRILWLQNYKPDPTHP